MRSAESGRRDSAAFRTPQPTLGTMGPLSDNDSSAVCLLEFAGTRALLCSDIERFAQGQILGLYPELKADVVVGPHHGSRRTLDERFLEGLGARILLCSCGRQDVERGRVIHQTPDRGSRGAGETQNLASLPPPADSLRPTADLYLTATNGAITVCTRGEGMLDVSSYIVNNETQTNTSHDAAP